jgi:hypothetical protein
MVKGYLLALPERRVRSVPGLGAGVAREVGEVAVPAGIRRGQLYQNLVDATRLLDRFAVRGGRQP